MEITTGAILRRITRTALSVSAHKLATLILDGIAWKEGYNGLERGTAAFTLADLAARMTVSRQHLHVLLAELAESGLRLLRHRLRGRPAIWLFRFGREEETRGNRKVSDPDDTAPYCEESNKTIFSGTIRVQCETALRTDRWLKLISSAKGALPCKDADSRHIWDQFLAFNRRRNHQTVPAGYLLGFMRRWQVAAAPDLAQHQTTLPRINDLQRELQRLIANAPVANRYFHESELRQLVGTHQYDARVADLRTRFGCSLFQGKLAVHGKAVSSGEIAR